MAKFKVGNKVKVIGNKGVHHNFPTGLIGTIIGFDDDYYDDAYYAGWDVQADGLTQSQTISECDLELLEEKRAVVSRTEFTVGDLISFLQEFPDDARIMIEGIYRGEVETSPLKSVTYTATKEAGQDGTSYDVVLR